MIVGRSVPVNTITKIFFIVFSTSAFLVALLTANYPPWGRFWEPRTLVMAFSGCLVGILVYVLTPGSKTTLGQRNIFSGIAPLVGINVFWALLIAGFNGNLSPAESPYNVPSWPWLYQLVLFFSTAVAWYWWRRSQDVVFPGLMLVILAGTADGMLFNHHALSMTYLYLAMVALWAGLVWIKYGIPSLRNIVVGGGLVLIVIAVVASALGASFGNSQQMIWRLLSGWLIAIGVISLRREKQNSTSLLLALMSAGLLIAFLCVVRYLYLIPIMGISNSVFQRLTMVRADPNALGSALILTLALLISLYKIFPPKLKFVFWLLVLLVCLPIFLSLSKSVWLGTLFMVVLGMVLSLKHRKRNLIILLSLVLALTAISIVSPRISARIFSEDSLMTREMIWQASFRSMLTYPLLGVGLNNGFIHAAFANDLPYQLVYSNRFYLNSHTHSLWLELIEAIGFIGLAWFVLMLGKLLWRKPGYNIWFVAALGGLLLTLTFMGGISAFNLIPFELWIAMALVVYPRHKSVNWFGWILIGAFLVSGLGMTAELFSRNAEYEGWSGNLAKARENILWAERLSPLNPDYVALEAQFFLREDKVQDAIRCYDRAIILAPGYPVWRGRRGVAKLAIEDLNGAVSDLGWATAKDYMGVLNSGEFHSAMAAALATAGDYDQAQKSLEEVALINPQFPQSPWAALATGNDGDFVSCLCPDFSPQGSATERYLRCKNWLLGNDYSSSGAFRVIYSAPYIFISYSHAVLEQLRKVELPDPKEKLNNLMPCFTLGNSYFQTRIAEGHIGDDLSLIFGSPQQIPLWALRLFITRGQSMETIGSRDIYPNLGLSLFARQNGKDAITPPLLEQAETETNKVIHIEESIKSSGETIKITPDFPPESPEMLLNRAYLFIKDRHYNDAIAVTHRLCAMLMMNDGGLGMAENIAMILQQCGDSGLTLLHDLEVEYGPTPLGLLIEVRLSILTGDYEKAQKDLEATHRLAPGNRTVQLQVIEGLIAAKGVPRAISLTAEYRNKHPNDIDGLSFLAGKMADIGRADISNQILKGLAETFPNSQCTYLAEAAVAARIQDRDAQDRALLKAFSMAPTSVDIIISLAYQMLSENKLDDAAGMIDRGLKISPSELGLWMARVDLANRENNPDKALEYARFTYELDPSQALSCINYAVQLLNMNRLDDAMTMLHDLLARQPENTDALYWRAVILEKQDRINEAMADYEKLISLKKTNLGAYVNLANLYLKQGQKDKALSLIQQGVDLFPREAWGWATLGNIANICGNYELAGSALDKAIALEPGNESYRTLRNNLGKPPLGLMVQECEAALAAKKYDEAMEKAEKAVTFYPDESWAWANLAYMAREAGKIARANQAIDRAIQISPQNQTWQSLRHKIQEDLKNRK